MLSANMKATLESVNEKSKEIAEQMKGSRHIFFCGGTDQAEQIAKEGALKMKELTYLHCQSLKMENLGNNFYGFLMKHPKTHIIFVLVDSQKDKAEFIQRIENMKEKLDFLPTFVSDIKDNTIRNRLDTLSSNRSIYVQKSGPTLSALLCVIPLQRLAYDLTLALG